MRTQTEAAPTWSLGKPPEKGQLSGHLTRKAGISEVKQVGIEHLPSGAGEMGWGCEGELTEGLGRKRQPD